MWPPTPVIYDFNSPEGLNICTGEWVSANFKPRARKVETVVDLASWKMSYEQTVEIRTSPSLFYLAVFRNLALLVRMAEPHTYRTLGSVWQVPSSCFAGGPDDFCTAARRASPTPVCERTKEHTHLYLSVSIIRLLEHQIWTVEFTSSNRTPATDLSPSGIHSVQHLHFIERDLTREVETSFFSIATFKN